MVYTKIFQGCKVELISQMISLYRITTWFTTSPPIYLIQVLWYIFINNISIYTLTDFLRIVQLIALINHVSDNT